MTVKDLIEALSIFPADKPVFICDADTGWYLDINDVKVSDNEYEVSGDDALHSRQAVVLLSGSYS